MASGSDRIPACCSHGCSARTVRPALAATAPMTRGRRAAGSRTPRCRHPFISSCWRLRPGAEARDGAPGRLRCCVQLEVVLLAHVVLAHEVAAGDDIAVPPGEQHLADVTVLVHVSLIGAGTIAGGAQDVAPVVLERLVQAVDLTAGGGLPPVAVPAGDAVYAVVVSTRGEDPVGRRPGAAPPAGVFVGVVRAGFTSLQCFRLQG